MKKLECVVVAALMVWVCGGETVAFAQGGQDTTRTESNQELAPLILPTVPFVPDIERMPVFISPPDSVDYIESGRAAVDFRLNRNGEIIRKEIFL